jgi:hypothetical protein
MHESRLQGRLIDQEAQAAKLKGPFSFGDMLRDLEHNQAGCAAA